MRQTRKQGRRTGRLISTGLLAGALVLTACGGDDATGGAGTDEATEAATQETATASADPDSPLAGDGEMPDFDLSGQSITFTTSKPGALNIGAFWVFDKLREWGAEVDEVILTTTSGIQTMIAGESDAGAHGSDEVFLGRAEGADVVAIGAPNSKMDYVLVGDTSIGSVADLEGKAIAMSGPSGFDALLSRLALEEAGLDPDRDASFVQIGGSPDRAAALVSGNVAAATIFLEDWYEIEQRTDELQLVSYMAEMFPQFPADVYFTNRAYLDEHPDMGTAIACANLESNSWINQDQESFIEYTLSKADTATEEGLTATYEAAQGVGMFPTDPPEVLSPDGMTALMEAMLETGDISSAVEVSEVVDTSYMEEAAEMGCG